MSLVSLIQPPVLSLQLLQIDDHAQFEVGLRECVVNPGDQDALLDTRDPLNIVGDGPRRLRIQRSGTRK